MWDLLQAVFKAIAGFCLTIFNALLDLALAAVPDTWRAPTETAIQYARIANAWAPIDVACVLLGIYVAFRLVWTCLRIVFRILRG